jgi:hypothetical protein
MAHGGAVSIASRDGGPWTLLLGCCSWVVDNKVRSHACRFAGQVHPAPGPSRSAPIDGEARLVETATVDNEVNRLWGEVNGIGRNILGVLLMELRADFRNNVEIVEAYLRAAECRLVT